MAEVRTNESGKVIKTKSRAARRAAFEKQIGHKVGTPKGKGAKK